MLHLVHERIGGIGGIQRFDLRALRGLAMLAAEEGCEFEVLALNGIETDLALPEQVEVSSASGSRFKLLQLLIHRHLTRRVTSVWVAHLRIQKAVWPARFIFFGSRYLLFVHGIEAWGAQGSRILRLAYRSLMNSFVDDVISVSRFTVARMIASFGLRWPRIHLLPNAQDVSDEILAEPYAASDVVADHPIVLTVARMDRHDMPKGIPVSLRAIDLLRKEFPRLKHRIVGDGELRMRHEALARELQLTSHVEFLGRVPDADLAALYHSADVFLLPSSKEGFGIVFLEAWRFGLPIVCGNVDASVEVVDNGVNGFAVSPDSPEDVASALRQLFLNPALRRQFATQGRQKILREYSNTSFIEGLRRIIADPRFDQASSTRHATVPEEG
ncbi:glycosyltransferase family 4 protein [Povalibacter sp.]|uniref:glycosyltransferase family 4 protein n=1 Tax=Povalibacter sp. TaxID=1962978 RepID=UPI002F41A8D6